MGQKVNPNLFRLGHTTADYSTARWYGDNKNFAILLQSDIEIRKTIRKFLPNGSCISKIIIERTGNVGKKNIKIYF